MRAALLERLRVLAAGGSLPGSRLSTSMRRELSSLFDARILVERRAGAGRRIEVADPASFARWIEHRLPEGLEPSLEGPPRAAAVAAYRDAKVARRTDAEPVLIRGFARRPVLAVDGAAVDVCGLTEQAGCASFLLAAEREVVLRGRIGVVENLEAFVYAERFGAGIDAALYSAGRISGRRLAWMAQQVEVRWVHLGDYDPVGLSEYLRVSAACDGRAELWVPEDLETLVARYSKAAVMEGSTAVWATVRASADPAVQRVVGALERHARGLEQEILVRDD